MHVVLMNKDITNLCTQIVWSGDYQQVSRKLEVHIAVSATDRNLPTASVSPGNMMRLYDNSWNELFRGYVFAKSKQTSSCDMAITAFDGLIYLIKSKGTYNFTNMTPEAITKKVTSDFNIPVGTLAPTGISVSFIAESQTIYDIITQAYTAASAQNGIVYMPLMDVGSLNVIEKGSYVADYVISENVNATDTEYEESIEDMVNRIRIYDSNHNQIGMVQNDSWVQSYGILQGTYNKETGIDPTTAAQNLLVGLAQTARLDTNPGNTACITGAAVCVQEPYTGIGGTFYINTDTHTWQNGQYSLELVVDAQAVMDAKTFKKYLREASRAIKKAGSASKKSSKKSSTSLLAVLEAGGYTQ